MWKGVTDNKKAKCLPKEEIKKKLLDSITIGEIVKFDDLNKETQEVQHPEQAVIITERYENIKTSRKGVINVAIIKDKFLKGLKKRKSLLSSSVNKEFTKLLFICKINV